jgi:hypothetical protein
VSTVVQSPKSRALTARIPLPELVPHGEDTLLRPGLLLVPLPVRHPGQDRFWFLWDEVAQGALGAVVLADARRLEDSFAAVDYFEHRDIPFIVAVNNFDGARRYRCEEVEQALDLDPGTPVVLKASPWGWWAARYSTDRSREPLGSCSARGSCGLRRPAVTNAMGVAAPGGSWNMRDIQLDIFLPVGSWGYPSGHGSL